MEEGTYETIIKVLTEKIDLLEYRVKNTTDEIDNLRKENNALYYHNDTLVAENQKLNALIDIMNGTEEKEVEGENENAETI